MQIRDFVQKGIMATLGMATLPELIRVQPPLHFIAIGESGGRILESLFKKGLPGRYNWIKANTVIVATYPVWIELSLIIPSRTIYITAHRNAKIPEV